MGAGEYGDHGLAAGGERGFGRLDDQPAVDHRYRPVGGARQRVGGDAAQHREQSGALARGAKLPRQTAGGGLAGGEIA